MFSPLKKSCFLFLFLVGLLIMPLRLSAMPEDRSGDENQNRPGVHAGLGGRSENERNQAAKLAAKNPGTGGSRSDDNQENSASSKMADIKGIDTAKAEKWKAAVKARNAAEEVQCIKEILQNTILTRKALGLDKLTIGLQKIQKTTIRAKLEKAFPQASGKAGSITHLLQERKKMASGAGAGRFVSDYEEQTRLTRGSFNQVPSSRDSVLGPLAGIDQKLITDYLNAATPKEQEKAFNAITGANGGASGASSTPAMAEPKQEAIRKALEYISQRNAESTSSSSSSSAASTSFPSTQQPGHEEDSPSRSADQTARRILADLAEKSLGHLVPDFLIAHPEKQIKEYQEKYRTARQALMGLSPEIAEALANEPLPKTEQEDGDFSRRYRELIKTSALGDVAKQAQLESLVAQVYRLKAALNVLDLAIEHRNRFSLALMKSETPERQDFLLGKIPNIDKTIRNLINAAASMVEATYSTIAPYALELIQLNTNYAEAIRAGDPKTARRLALLAKGATYRRNAAEARLANDFALARYWNNAALASENAAKAIAAGNEDAADLFIQAATYYEYAVEPRLARDWPLANYWDDAALASENAAKAIAAGTQALAALYYIQEATYRKNAAEAWRDIDFNRVYIWDDAALASKKAADAIAAGKQAVAALYIQAVTYYEHAVEEHRAGNSALSNLYRDAGRAFGSAAYAIAAGEEDAGELYIQAATYYKNALEAELAGNSPLAGQWKRAAIFSYNGANALIRRSYEQAAQYKARAEEIVRGIISELEQVK